MAQFNYAQYEQQQAARQAQKANGSGERKPVHFMNEFLGKSGDQVIVRFPYTCPDDFVFETVHKVVGVFPGDKFGKMVSCSGDDTCPLCKSADENVKKLLTRFYAKMVVYNVGNSGIEKCATVWERPGMFADTDLKNLMTEYGDLTNYLFKITRTGSGTDTRYTLMPVNMQSPVYSGAGYEKDFTCLDGIDPVKILTKSIKQYNDIVNPTANAEATTTVASTSSATTAATNVAVSAPAEAPKAPATAEEVVNSYVNPTYGSSVATATPAEAPTAEAPKAPATRAGRYSF